MNTTRRIHLLKQVERLHNRLQASRMTLEDFASSAWKPHVDAALAELAVAALPANYRRHRPRRWADLRPQDKDRLSKRLFNKAARANAQAKRSRLHEQLTTLGILDADVRSDIIWGHVTEAARDHRRSTYNMRFPRWHGHTLPEGTPVTRLYAKRLSTLNTYRQDIPRYERLYMLGAEFIAGLHPDDAEWEAVIVEDKTWFKPVAAADVIRLAGTFPNQRVLAALPYIDDPETRSEVYYVAYLHLPRKGPPRVERCYLGRQWHPEAKAWWITERFKTGSAAYSQCHAIFATAMSHILYTEAKDA
jgi:hypothetical protein